VPNLRLITKDVNAGWSGVSWARRVLIANDSVMDLPKLWDEPINAWLGSLAVAKAAPLTIEKRQYHLARLAWAFRTATPWELTTEQIAVWLISNGWGKSTIRSFRSGVSAFYSWGVKAGRTEENPAAELPRVRPADPVPRPADPVAVAQALAKCDDRVRLMIRLADECGLRRREVACVHTRDLIHVDCGWELVIHGKGDKERIAHITDSLAAAIRNHVKDGFLFPGKIDGHLSPYRVGELVANALEHKYTMHQLRHLFATEILSDTKDVRMVQQLLGHANLNSTTVYLAVAAGPARDAVISRAERLNRPVPHDKDVSELRPITKDVTELRLSKPSPAGQTNERNNMPTINRATLGRTIAVINGKGGVGKTTLTANIAGLLANSGFRVLAIDLDPQGNLGIDFGYRHTDADDDGKKLSSAMAFGHPAEPMKNVRENLDVLSGGGALRVAAAALEAGSVTGDPRDALVRAIAPIASNYDIVLIDCPPGGEALQNAAAAAARWILVPSSVDAGGAGGLALVAERIAQVSDINPSVDLLGTVVFNVTTRATKVIETTKAMLRAVAGDDDVVFKTVIRHSPSYAQQARQFGHLAHELEDIAAAQPKWWEAPDAINRVSDTAGKVAGDFQALTKEIVDRISQREASEVAA